MTLGQNIVGKLIQKTSNKGKNVSGASNKRVARIANNTNKKALIGRPSKDMEAVTFDTKKMTFYVKGDLLTRLYNFAYWERHSLTEAFNKVLQDGLKGKNTRDKNKA